MLLFPSTPEPSSEKLPLFRPEVLAAQQRKFCGEIRLTRPLSTSLFVWLGIIISAAFLAYLSLATYNERVRVTGYFLAEQAAQPVANLYVPTWARRFVYLGERVSIRYQSCTAVNSQVSIGTVTDIASLAISPPELVPGQIPGTEPMFRIGLTLPATSQPPSDKTGIEADLPVGRKPLLKWLFKGSNSAAPSQ